MLYRIYIGAFLATSILANCGMSVKVDPKPLKIIHEGGATVTLKLDPVLYQAFIDQCTESYTDPSEANACITERIADFFNGLNNPNSTQ